MEAYGYNPMGTGKERPRSIEDVPGIGFDVERCECPRFGALPLVHLCIELRPLVAAETVSLVSFKDRLQDRSELENDAVGPRFIVVVGEDGRVFVVGEGKVEGLLRRQRDVDVLAEGDPGRGFAEAAVCCEGGDAVEDAGGAEVVALFVRVSHFFVEAEKDDCYKKILIPMG